jgi:hypothetical protein
MNMENKNTPLIISFCNWNYSKVALNWVAYLEKLGITNYLIVSLDKKTEDFLRENSINTKLMEGQIPRRSGTGWRWRFQKTYDFLKSGTNIIHSDLDAVWLRNPLHLLDEESDIIASVDRGGFPPETFERWKFTMCMGWMFYRSNSKVLGIFEDILLNEKDFDDQIEMNNYLSSRIMLENIYNMVDGGWKMKLENLNIKVLDKGVVKRGDFDENAYVCHPLMKKKADCKTQLKRRGLWVL